MERKGLNNTTSFSQDKCVHVQVSDPPPPPKHTHTHARTHTHAHTRTHARTRAHTRAHTRARTHTLTYTHTHTHTHTQTHKNTQTHSQTSDLQALCSSSPLLLINGASNVHGTYEPARAIDGNMHARTHVYLYMRAHAFAHAGQASIRYFITHRD
jgi:hypothetical protein